jgi:hypothetical protein
MAQQFDAPLRFHQSRGGRRDRHQARSAVQDRIFSPLTQIHRRKGVFRSSWLSEQHCKRGDKAASGRRAVSVCLARWLSPLLFERAAVGLTFLRSERLRNGVSVLLGARCCSLSRRSRLPEGPSRTSIGRGVWGDRRKCDGSRWKGDSMADSRGDRSGIEGRSKSIEVRHRSAQCERAPTFLSTCSRR